MSSLYATTYLEQYWPPRPVDSDTWRDNLDFLRAYFLAAERILAEEGRQVDALDVSTGPCLAPIMALQRCLRSVRTSDYTMSNRDAITRVSIDYWLEYAHQLEDMFPGRVDARLWVERTDELRRMFPPLDVDLRRCPMFLPDVVGRGSADLLTMHFVVDSICDTARECFEMFEQVLTFVRPGGWLLLTALTDSEWWLLGESRQPSARLTAASISGFLQERGYEIHLQTCSPERPLRLHDGGWTILLAKSSSGEA